MDRKFWADHPLILTIGAFAIAATLVGLGFAMGSAGNTEVAQIEDADSTQVGPTETSQPLTGTPDQTTPTRTPVSDPTTETTPATPRPTPSEPVLTPTPAPTPTPTPTPTPSSVPATEIPTIGQLPRFGPLSMDLKPYDEVFLCHLHHNTSSGWEFRVDRTFSRLTGEVGFADDGDKNHARTISILNEAGTELFRTGVSLISGTQPLDIDVSGNLRIIIRCSAGTSSAGIADLTFRRD